MKTLQSRIIIPMLSMVAFATMLSPDTAAQTGAWLTPSHDAQHSAVSSVRSQALRTIHWSVPVDLAPPAGEITLHYGSPLVTEANTVIVPVKTGANNFRVEARNGKSGALLWALKTAYHAPAASFTQDLDQPFPATTFSFPTVQAVYSRGKIQIKPRA